MYEDEFETFLKKIDFQDMTKVRILFNILNF
jgi:hypothetical protein